MKLTIKNIENIEDRKLPKLDGYTISLVKIEKHEYEFDIYLNHTLKMVLKVNRDSNYDGIGDKNNYTCTIIGWGISNNHKWQVVLDRTQFGTKLGFLMAAGEMANKILLQQAKEKEYLNGLPSVSAGTHITQSLSLSFKESKPNPTYKIKKIMQELGQLPDYILHNIQYYIRKIV